MNFTTLRHTRGALLAALAILLLGGFAAGCGSDDDGGGGEASAASGAAATGAATTAAEGDLDLSAVTLRVADIQSNSRPLFEAAGQARGLAYRIEWVPFQNGQPAYQALAADRIDIVSAGDTSAIFAQAAGTPIKVVGVLRPQDSGLSQQAILVPRGSEIRSLEDLRGKKIGFFESTPTQYLLLKALDRAGLTLDDVTAVNLPFQQGLSALGSGQIDAWATMGPFVPISKAQFGATELVSGAGISDDQSYIAARAGALEDAATKAAIGDYVVRSARAREWALTNDRKYAEIAARVKKAPVEIALAEIQLAPSVIKPVDAEAIEIHQRQADRLVESGALPRRIDAAELFVDDFNEQLPAER